MKMKAKKEEIQNYVIRRYFKRNRPSYIKEFHFATEHEMTTDIREAKMFLNKFNCFSLVRKLNSPTFAYYHPDVKFRSINITERRGEIASHKFGF